MPARWFFTTLTPEPTVDLNQGRDRGHGHDGRAVTRRCPKAACCATIRIGRARREARSPVNWNRITLGGGLIGAVVVAGAIIVYNWGATPRLEGRITEVRTLGMDDRSSVAIINFEASNASNYEISVTRREMAVVDENGTLLEGRILSVFDIQQLFNYFPALGGMKDEPLLDEQFLAPGERVRGLSAARFEIPKHELDVRQEIIFRTLDVKNRRTEIRMVSP